MFDKNYLGHNFKRVSPSHEEYICEKCGIDIEHVDSDLLKNHKLKKKYKGNLGYLLMIDGLTVLYLTCEEVIIKNIIE